jgi:putative RNA 2'-phosphotransferase
MEQSMSVDRVKLSKFLSFVLRHNPGTIGLGLDAQGCARIDELIKKAGAAGRKFRREDLLDVVATNDKKRFSLSEDGLRIRAAQGHSVAVDLGLPPKEPPQVLYHGTATRFLDAIWSEGLKPQARQQCISRLMQPRRYASVSVTASRSCCRSTPTQCTRTASNSILPTMACG